MRGRRRRVAPGRAVAALEQRVGDHDQADHHDHPQAQRVADVLLAGQHVAGHHRADLDRDQRDASGARRVGGRIGGESVGEQQEQRAEEGRREQRAADAEPVLPPRGAEAARGLLPLRTQAVERGEDHQEHQRDLEVEVDQHQAGHVPQDEAVLREVVAGAVQPLGDQTLRAQRGQEDEGQRQAAEVGQHAGGGGDRAVREAVAPRAGDRDRERQAEDRAQDRAEHGQLDADGEGVPVRVLHRRGDVRQRRVAGVVLEGGGDHRVGRGA